MGVFICAGKRRVAGLDYLGIDGFGVKFCLFLLIESNELSRLLRDLSDKSRDPKHYYTFLDKVTDEEVADLDFLFGYRGG